VFKRGVCPIPSRLSAIDANTGNALILKKSLLDIDIFFLVLGVWSLPMRFDVKHNTPDYRQMQIIK
jgi:hypothetical protein